MDAGDWQYLVFVVIGIVLLTAAGIVLVEVRQAPNNRLVPESGDGRERGAKTTRAIVHVRRSVASAMVFIQVVLSVLVADSVLQLPGIGGPWIRLLIVAVTYLLFGLAIPRAVTSKASTQGLVDRLLSVGRGVARIIPVDWVVNAASSAVGAVLPGPDVEEESIGTEDEIRISRHGSDDGIIGETERQMIDGILSLEEMTVRDIMVPRLDVIALERRVSAAELIDTITNAGHSRIPVYRDSIDNVLGVLYVKDLLPFVIGNTLRIPLLDLIRPAFVVPESKRLAELFPELKRARIHIAIVADEYGGTAGLVTIEDILEEIVGEIQDEYDTEKPLFELVGDDALLADGRLPIEDVEDALGVEFEEDDDFGTLGGFVHKHLGRLAIQGDTFDAEGVRIEIKEVERHRVRSLLITRLESPDEDSDDEGGSDRRRRNGAVAQESDVPAIDPDRST